MDHILIIRRWRSCMKGYSNERLGIHITCQKIIIRETDNFLFFIKFKLLIHYENESKVETKRSGKPSPECFVCS